MCERPVVDPPVNTNYKIKQEMPGPPLVLDWDWMILMELVSNIATFFIDEGEEVADSLLSGLSKKVLKRNKQPNSKHE